MAVFTETPMFRNYVATWFVRTLAKRDWGSEEYAPRRFPSFPCAKRALVFESQVSVQARQGHLYPNR